MDHSESGAGLLFTQSSVLKNTSVKSVTGRDRTTEYTTSIDYFPILLFKLPLLLLKVKKIKKNKKTNLIQGCWFSTPENAARGSDIKTTATEVGQMAATTDKKKSTILFKNSFVFPMYLRPVALRNEHLTLEKMERQMLSNQRPVLWIQYGKFPPFKRYSNSQAIEKIVSISNTITTFLWVGWGKKPHKVFSTTVLLSKVILHTLQRWKEYLHFEMTRPSRLAWYKNKELKGNGRKREVKLPCIKKQNSPFPQTTIFVHHSIC